MSNGTGEDKGVRDCLDKELEELIAVEDRTKDEECEYRDNYSDTLVWLKRYIGGRRELRRTICCR